MEIGFGKSFSLKREISSGCRSSILTDNIEFRSYNADESLEKRLDNYGKYTVLTPDQQTKWIVTKKVEAEKIVELNKSIKLQAATNGFVTPSYDAIGPRKVIVYNKKVHLEWKQVNKVGAGLVNLGNTCYMNSVLQCLTYCPPLINYLLYCGDDHHSQCKISSFCMICEFQQHVLRSYNSPNGAIKPSNIHMRLKSIARHFHPNRQEDAHEFLRYVLDHMWKSCTTNFELTHNSVKLDPRSKETTVINEIFGGYHRSQVTCSVCKAKSDTHDYFMDFILDIKEINNLEDAFRKFTQPEILSNDNAYKCPNCKKKVMATKRFTVYKPPNVATIQFKRFDYNRIYGGKITKKIAYPETFNIRPFMSDSKGSPILYKLNAVLVHLGSTSNSGHYYCYIKSSNGLWYLMDDDRVIKVNINQVLDQQAYILFYVRWLGLNNCSADFKKMGLNNNNNNNQQKSNGIMDNIRSITVHPNGNGNAKFTNGGSPQFNSINKLNNSNGNRLSVSGDKPSSTGSSESDTLPGQTRMMKISSNSLVDYDDDSSDDDSDCSNPVQNGFAKIMNPNQFNGAISKKAEKRLRKLKKKNKKKRKRKKYSEELEWIERTKETVEKERRIKNQI
ncbi:probable ubiquitin carboxyl-terminal hydrolase 16 [Tetranychus urticae]|uniref:Ubiquitin carboxyl-terminal hydrolase n=1 Tax=Tetranychus urticae TaxID=32264 RepID=T1KDB8_TETUR|nr:probable ubiquitin carboxyl-terminal hydrolase 16 [Tetranychus urticae]